MTVVPFRKQRLLSAKAIGMWNKDVALNQLQSGPLTSPFWGCVCNWFGIASSGTESLPPRGDAVWNGTVQFWPARTLRYTVSDLRVLVRRHLCPYMVMTSSQYLLSQLFLRDKRQFTRLVPNPLISAIDTTLTQFQVQSLCIYGKYI